MALTQIEQVRLLIGDTPTSPFYQLFSDDEIQFFIDTQGTVINAAKMAAVAASLQLAGWNTREITGDIHVYNALSSQYIKALDNFIKEASTAASIPNGLMPYAAGISWSDVNANNANLDNVRPGLTQIKLCSDDTFNYTNPFRI